MSSPEIERLIGLLAKLPGLGPRSARRAVLYLLKRLTIDHTGMGEVKAQLFSVDQGTFLLDVITEHLSQRGVKQVSGGVIGAARAHC